MSRLIDANKLYKEMSELIMRHPSVFTMGQGFMILGLIDKQPIAFAPEAVVRELEELKMAEYDDSDEEPCYTDVEDVYDEGVSDGKYKAYHKAIEIVNRGGRNE